MKNAVKLAACIVLMVFMPFSVSHAQQTGCQGNQQGGVSKEDIGTVAGALLGGLLGSKVGKGGGRKIATVLGAVAGGYAGKTYGKQLDCQDQQYHSQTTHEALEYQPSGRASSWNNPDSGHSGTITPVKTWQRDTGQYCRDYTQSIIVDGQIQEAQGTACRDNGGNWRIVSSEQPQQYPDYSRDSRYEEQF